MTRLIEAYQTSDGTIHLTRSAADKHQQVVLTNAFGELIDNLYSSDMGMAARLRMCERLEILNFTNPGYLVNILQDIINIIHHDDDGEE